MNAPPERLTALKASSAHLGAFPDTEMLSSGRLRISYLMHAAMGFKPWNLNSTW